jgi:hypothetical protein
MAPSCGVREAGVIGTLEISEISSPDWSEWSEQDIVAQGELKKKKMRGNAYSPVAEKTKE